MKAKPARRKGEVTLQLNRRDEALMEAAAGTPRSPFQIRKILVPIDFSECSKKALRYAVPLARQHRAALALLYVVPPVYRSGEYGGIDYAALESEMSTSGKAELVKLEGEEVPDELSSEILVRGGAPALEIIDVARTLPADVIVISTHGRTGLKHVVLGSVAEHVVRRAPCPVLVVREHEHEFLAA